MATCCENHFVGNARRLLRGDPTRTLSISRRFLGDFRRRFRKTQKEVFDFLVTKDALGLVERVQPSIRGIFNVAPKEFEFATDPAKLDAFNSWFKQQTETNILSPSPGTDPTKPWTSEYVDSAYKKGQLNAYLSTKEAKLLTELGVGDETAAEFLRSSFIAPETVSKLRLLGTRTFDTLAGITGQMSTDMSRIMAQGLADGSGPREIAKTMAEQIQGISKRRAETIARTEVIMAHAEGQLDAFEKLGVEELGLTAEWSTAGDDRVCPDCFAREGEIFLIKEARGLIPLHPNCRCTWVPSPDEPTKNRPQRRSAARKKFREQGGALPARPLRTPKRDFGDPRTAGTTIPAPAPRPTPTPRPAPAPRPAPKPTPRPPVAPKPPVVAPKPPVPTPPAPKPPTTAPAPKPKPRPRPKRGAGPNIGPDRNLPKGTKIPSDYKAKDFVSRQVKVVAQGGDTAAVTANIRTAIKNLDRSHTLPTWNLWQRNSNKSNWFQRKKIGRNGNTNGQYSGQYKSVEIKQGLRKANQRMTAYHEFGHYIDDNYFGVPSGGFGGGKFGSEASTSKLWSSPERLKRSSALGVEGDAKMKKLMDFIKDTDSYKTLISDASHTRYSTAYVNYVSSDVELFARSYAQYIAEKSKDTEVLSFMDQITKGRASYMPTSQWTKAEMKKMVPLYDDLFNELAKQSSVNAGLTP